MAESGELTPPPGWPPAQWPPSEDDPIALLNRIIEKTARGRIGYRDALGSYLIAMIDLENAINAVLARHIVAEGDEAMQEKLRVIVLERLPINTKFPMLRHVAGELGLLPQPAKSLLKRIEDANALRNDLAHGKAVLDDETEERFVTIGSGRKRSIVSIREEVGKVDDLTAEFVRVFANPHQSNGTT